MYCSVRKFDSTMAKIITDFFIGFKKGQKLFGNTIASVVNTILLTFVYIIGVGGTAIASKIIKKEFLQKEINPKRKSYWLDLNLEKKKMEEYYKQY